MKRSIHLFVLPAVLLGALPARADDKPNYDAYFDHNVAAAMAPMPGQKAAAADGFASAIDERRGIPTFIWAGAQQPLPPVGLTASPELAARFYVGVHAHRWNLPSSIAGDLQLDHVHNTGRGGIIVAFKQRVNGVEIFHGVVKALMARNFELIALSGAPRAGATELKGNGATFSLKPADAIAKAMNDLYGSTLKAADFAKLKKVQADYGFFDLAPTQAAQATGLRTSAPFRVKKVYFQLPNRLIAAYFLEITAGEATSTDGQMYAYVIAADDGRVLFRQNLTASDFSYKVYADADGRPTDGPIGDVSPHPTGIPDMTPETFIAPTLITTDGFNTNPVGQHDPWLSASAVQTKGNNVDCYTDDSAPNGYSNGDLRATTTAAKVFDRTYDLALEPQANTNQSMASATQLFYVNNWLHDRFYDSGFDEIAGNAQDNNFLRGGLDGDVLLAEAQDAYLIGQRNNANMSTPADGASPRMQMYIWAGKEIATGFTHVNTSTDYPVATASWGLRNFDFIADAVIADDGTGTLSDACQPIQNNIVGKIVLVDQGGGCNSSFKAANASAKGAVGMLFLGNTAGVPPGPLGNLPPGPVTLGGLAASFETGVALKAAINSGIPQQLHFLKQAEVERDGTIDNSIVAHEWGHYIHHRLVLCGQLQCGGMSEGWGDFTALQMMVRPGDNLDGTYAVSVYSTPTFTDDSTYHGLRRAPYSTNMNANGFTFKHMTDGVPLPTTPLGAGTGNANSEVHNTGDVWANIMFESYVGLLKDSKGASPRFTFDEARRLMNDYVVAGMKMAPVEPTYTQQRDAIFAAAYASDPLDMNVLATGFAKRGMGTCAVSPPIFTGDNAGIVESFTTQGNFAVLSVELKEDAASACDADGVVDAEETGTLTVTIMNTGITTLAGTTVNVTTANPLVSYPGGTQVTLPDIAPYATTTATFGVAVDPSAAAIDKMDLKVDVANPDSCDGAVSINTIFGINYDNLAESANLDTVESDILGWKSFELFQNGPDADDVWSRDLDVATGNHSWHGVDYPAHSDVSLESPELEVSATDPLIVTFDSTYSFEWDPTTNWDGAVLEVAEVGGPWKDITTYLNPGYGGLIAKVAGADNPLGGRQGFVHENAAFPMSEPMTLDFGMQLAGKTIQIRFRVGSDAAAGAFGWQVDNLKFKGITNTPFPSVIPDKTQCKHPPVANAGSDQTVPVKVGVLLDGSTSSDPDNDMLSYDWAQTNGYVVGIINPKSAKPTFVSPDLSSDETLTFELTVTDGTATAKDSVNIVVKAPVAPGTGGAGGSGVGGGGVGGGGVGGGGVGGGSGGMESSSSTGSDAVTSTTGSGSGTGGSTGGSDSGCDCTVTGTSSNAGNGGALGLGLLGAAMLYVRRRRMAKRS